MDLIIFDNTISEYWMFSGENSCLPINDSRQKKLATHYLRHRITKILSVRDNNYLFSTLLVPLVGLILPWNCSNMILMNLILHQFLPFYQTWSPSYMLKSGFQYFLVWQMSGLRVEDLLKEFLNCVRLYTQARWLTT